MSIADGLNTSTEASTTISGIVTSLKNEVATNQGAGHNVTDQSTDRVVKDLKLLDEPGGLMKLFYCAVKKLHSVENNLINAKPGIIKSAEINQLKEALAYHRQQTKVHAERLQQVFELLGESKG